MQNLPSTRTFSAISMKGVLTGICCEGLGLIFGWMASWWQFSFRTLFRASLTLKWALPPPWQHQWCHSIQFFICFQKKLLFFTFIEGNKVFDFWMVIPSQKSENYEPPLNHNHGFHGNQVCFKRLNFGQAFRKTLLEYIARNGRQNPHILIWLGPGRRNGRRRGSVTCTETSPIQSQWHFRSDCLLPSEIGTSWCGRILHSMAFVLFCLYLSKIKRKKKS